MMPNNGISSFPYIVLYSVFCMAKAFPSKIIIGQPFENETKIEMQIENTEMIA